jgi:hypothetical protein
MIVYYYISFVYANIIDINSNFQIFSRLFFKKIYRLQFCQYATRMSGSGQITEI